MEMRYSHPYEAFLHSIEKPGRYIGNEYGVIQKKWIPRSKDMVSIALAFPDLYEIGMSHLGLKILYNLVNQQPKRVAERLFCPWPDCEAALRAHKQSLVTNDSLKEAHLFDIIGFSLQYELNFSNILTILDLSGIPLRREDRPGLFPLIIGGGPVAAHPEPISDFFDLFVIGDGENALLWLMDQVELAKQTAAPPAKAAFLARIVGSHDGFYAPALTAAEANPHHPSRHHIVHLSRPICKNTVSDIDAYPFPEHAPVPYAKATFHRLAVEIARGCTEGCRFCQAGYIYRPLRERQGTHICRTIEKGLTWGGYQEVSLTALSTADYSALSPLVNQLSPMLKNAEIGFSVASLRAYGIPDSVLSALQTTRNPTLTFAPEAGTDRLRAIINKNISEDDLIQTAHRVFAKGWQRCKLYFMIGLPGETDDDIRGIVDLALKIKSIARRYQPPQRVNIVISVSTFIPKPHTPFEFADQCPPLEIQRRQEIIFMAAKRAGIVFKRHDRTMSFLEGVLARGDRQLGRVIEAAWRRGARFCGWDNMLNADAWFESFDALSINPYAYLHGRTPQEFAPWTHIAMGVRRAYLAAEWHKALEGQNTPACAKPMGLTHPPETQEEAAAAYTSIVCDHCGIGCDPQKIISAKLKNIKTAMAFNRFSSHTSAARARAAALPHWFRLTYSRLPPANFLGHQDFMDVMLRILRRTRAPIHYSEGFHRHPKVRTHSALPLGFVSLEDNIDIQLDITPAALDAETFVRALNEKSEAGLVFHAIHAISKQDAFEPRAYVFIPKSGTSADSACAVPPLPDTQWSSQMIRIPELDFCGRAIGAISAKNPAPLRAMHTHLELCAKNSFCGVTLPARDFKNT